MRVVAVIQARTQSTRLPGKVLKDLGGRSILEWVVRAGRAAAQIDDVIVATTHNPADDALVEECARLGVSWVRGDEDDVLDRYLEALEAYPSDAVVRITSDCPLLDPEVIDLVAGTWRASPHLDYMSTVLVRTLPHGLDVELVSREALVRVGSEATGHHRVHVTSGIYTQPQRYRVMGLVFAPDASEFRVTVDTPDDLAAVRAMIAQLGDGPVQWSSLVELLQSRPDLVAMNAHVRQKTLAEG